MDDTGSCPGNCTHVWNYTQTAAFLFPELEQSMRRNEFSLETERNKMISFRNMRVLFNRHYRQAEDFPVIDGQLGCIIRL